MGQMFEINDKDLQIVKDTQFVDIRKEVCQQSTLYNTIISPFGACVLQDTSAFFSNFLCTYENLEDLKDAIELVCDDAYLIVQGFEICKKIHEPILTAAELNKIKANAVQREIGDKFDSLHDDYEALMEKVHELEAKTSKGGN